MLTPQDIEAFSPSLWSTIEPIFSPEHGGARSNVLAIRGVVRGGPTGLDKQIDTPRVYREEKLPKSLPWATVQAFLRGIDRTTPSGIRDYAIFLLIATYGLRGCDIVTLTLDDVAWRALRLRIQQPKTGRLLWLPLTARSSQRCWNTCAEAVRISE